MDDILGPDAKVYAMGSIKFVAEREIMAELVRVYTRGQMLSKYHPDDVIELHGEAAEFAIEETDLYPGTLYWLTRNSSNYVLQCCRYDAEADAFVAESFTGRR